MQICSDHRNTTSMDVYLPPQGVSSLLSMAHFCPGLHGPGCDHDCKWLSFRAFFEATRVARRQLIIPLFQRSYCWHRAMLEAWWRDATGGQGHRVGTVFTKDREDARTVVIDGQQRLTTAMLMVAAIRDAALGLLQQAAAAAAGAEAFVLNACVEHLETALYLHRDEKCSVPQWALRTASSLRAGESRWGAVHPVGAQFPLALLQPSFVDRAPFFQLITIGRVQHADSLLLAEKTRAEPEPELEPEPLSAGPVQMDVCSDARSTLLAAAKRFFDEAVRNDLRRWRAGGMGAQISRVQQLGKAALDTLVLQSVSIVNPINYTQVRCSRFGTADGRWKGSFLHACTKRLKLDLSRFNQLGAHPSLTHASAAQVFLYLQEKDLFGGGAAETGGAREIHQVLEVQVGPAALQAFWFRTTRGRHFALSEYSEL